MNEKNASLLNREELVTAAVKLKEDLIHHQARFESFTEFASVRNSVDALIAAIKVSDNPANSSERQLILVPGGKPCIPKSLH